MASLYFVVVCAFLFKNASGQCLQSLGGLQTSTIPAISQYGAGNLALSAGNLPLIGGNLPFAANNLQYAAGGIPLSAGNFPLSSGNYALSSGNFPISAGNFPISAGNYQLTGLQGLQYGGNLALSNKLAGGLGLSQQLLGSANGLSCSGSSLPFGNNLAYASVPFGSNFAVNGLSALSGLPAANGMLSNNILSPYGGGITVSGENLYIDGSVAVSGSMPFLSSVAFGGGVPTSGTAAVSNTCSCGSPYIY